MSTGYDVDFGSPAAMELVDAAAAAAAAGDGVVGGCVVAVAGD